MDRKIAAIALMLLLWASTAQAEYLTVFFLDVGEGEAIYLETPGNKRILVDAGNLITGHRVVTFLEERGIKKLDALIITHPHPDHMGGVFHIIQHMDVKKLYDNGQTLNVRDDLYRWYRELYRRKNYKALRAGDHIKEGEVLLEVLWPEMLTSDWNTNSLILKIVYGETSVLLMGDAHVKVEAELIKNGTHFKADILKLGHHGAEDSSSEVFLNAVSPEFAIISTDKNNLREYPAPDVINRLFNRGIKVFFTYRDGNIIFSSNGERVNKLTE